MLAVTGIGTDPHGVRLCMCRHDVVTFPHFTRSIWSEWRTPQRGFNILGFGFDIRFSFLLTFVAFSYSHPRVVRFDLAAVFDVGFAFIGLVRSG